MSFNQKYITAFQPYIKKETLQYLADLSLATGECHIGLIESLGCVYLGIEFEG